MNPLSSVPHSAAPSAGRSRRVLACRAFLWLSPALVALGAPAAPSTPKISALLLDDGPYWRVVAQGLEDTARAAAMPIATILPPVSTGGAQAKYLQVIAADSPAVVLADPYFPEQTIEIFRRFARDHVKLVSLDTELPEDIPHVIVGHDQDKICAQAAEVVAAVVRPKEDVALLRQPGAETFTPRERAIMTAVKAAQHDAVLRLDIYGSARPAEAVSQACLLLANHAHTTLVVTTSSAMSAAMLQALRETGRAGQVRFVAFGSGLSAAVEAAVENGTITAWVAQDPYELGARAATVALALGRGETVPARNLVPATVVTKENLHEPALQRLRHR